MKHIDEGSKSSNSDMMKKDQSKWAMFKIIIVMSNLQIFNNDRLSRNENVWNMINSKEEWII